MLTIEKTYGVKGVANDKTILRLQELIADAKCQYGWVGKAVIDTEKITYSKFGMKLGIQRLSTNGLVVNEYGIIRDDSFDLPVVMDRQVLKDVYNLFGKHCPFA